MHLLFASSVNPVWNPLRDTAEHCPLDPILTGSTCGPTVVLGHGCMTRKLTLTCLLCMPDDPVQKHRLRLVVVSRRVIVPLVSTFLPMLLVFSSIRWHILGSDGLLVENVTADSRLALVTQYPMIALLVSSVNFSDGLLVSAYRPIAVVLCTYVKVATKLCECDFLLIRAQISPPLRPVSRLGTVLNIVCMCPVVSLLHPLTLLWHSPSIRCPVSLVVVTPWVGVQVVIVRGTFLISTHLCYRCDVP